MFLFHEINQEIFFSDSIINNSLSLSLNYENVFKTKVSYPVLDEIKMRELYRFSFVSFYRFKLRLNLLISFTDEKNKLNCYFNLLKEND